MERIYSKIDGSLSNYNTIIIEKGFFFIIVTKGTASIKDTYNDYIVTNDSLIAITPGIRGILYNKSIDFYCYCLYIEPDYFDTLSVGQLAYNHLSRHIGNFHMPIFQLDSEQTGYLTKIINLFARPLEYMTIYHERSVENLCSFLLLQLTESIYKTEQNLNTTCCVKRSNEIFRNFKKLAVHHYREYHDISFYANKLNISSTYLSRTVKSLTGHTVKFHISELIFADAQKLLECTDLDIKEIADILGFSDQSVFGKFFVRKTKISPLKFRQLRRK